MQLNSSNCKYYIKSLINKIVLLNNRRESVSKAFQYDDKFHTHKFIKIAFENRYTTYGYAKSLYYLVSSAQAVHQKSLLNISKLICYIVISDNDSKKNKEHVSTLLNLFLNIINGKTINDDEFITTLHQKYPAKAFGKNDNL